MKFKTFFLDNCDPSTYDFTKDWSSYWVERIQVYYNKELRKIIDRIGANCNLIHFDEQFTTSSLPTIYENTTQSENIVESNDIIVIGICISIKYIRFISN